MVKIKALWKRASGHPHQLISCCSFPHLVYSSRFGLLAYVYTQPRSCLRALLSETLSSYSLHTHTACPLTSLCSKPPREDFPDHLPPSKIAPCHSVSYSVSPLMAFITICHYNGYLFIQFLSVSLLECKLVKSEILSVLFIAVFGVSRTLPDA